MGMFTLKRIRSWIWSASFQKERPATQFCHIRFVSSLAEWGSGRQKSLSSAWMKCEDIENRGSSTVDTSVRIDVWPSTVLYHECSRHSNDPLQTHSCGLLDADIFHSTSVENFHCNSFRNSPCSLCDDIMMLEPTEITECSKMVKLHIRKKDVNDIVSEYSNRYCLAIS